MAEYYPLISRAVAGLRGGAPEARQAIYSRAKQALVAQLRGMQPPVPEQSIDKEIAALDEAIARIESELTAASAPASVTAAPAPSAPSLPSDEAPRAPVVQPAPAPMPRAEAAASPSPPPPPAPRQTAVRPPAPPVMSAGAAPARSERAVFERRASLPAARPLAPRSTRPSVPARPPTEAKDEPPSEAAPRQAALAEIGSPEPSAEAPGARNDAVPVLQFSEPAPALPHPPSAREAEPKVMPLPSAPTLETRDLDRTPDEATTAAPLLRVGRDEADDAAQPLPPVPDILASDLRGREEGIRPAMPRQTVRAPRDLRVWIVAFAALAAVVAIALTAWKLKDNPEQLARVPTPTTSEPAAGKIVERADGVGDDADPDAVTPSPAAVAPPQAQPASQANAPAAAGPQQPVGDQAIAIAYKAAILVAAPDTPEKVKTYVGTVVWRTESVPQGQDQPLGTAVRADIDVPDAKVQAVMELRKNVEAQFPASHTIDLKFTIGSASPIGSIKQIDVPRMRSEETPTGDPLVGVPVTITSNYFLVGLTRGAAEQRNVDGIRTHGWFDIPMVLENGTPAKITFEKGASGDRILNDVLAAWSRS